jgi:hypothetical protein
MFIATYCETLFVLYCWVLNLGVLSSFSLRVICKKTHTNIQFLPLSLVPKDVPSSVRSKLFPFLLLFWVALALELRASSFLDRCCSSLATLSVHFCVCYFRDRVF